MRRFPRDVLEQDALLLRARRLCLAAQGQHQPSRGSVRAIGGLDRLRVCELVEDLGQLIGALKAQMTAIDAELGKVSRQSQAALMYGKANRKVGQARSIRQIPPKNGSLL